MPIATFFSVFDTHEWRILSASFLCLRVMCGQVGKRWKRVNDRHMKKYFTIIISHAGVCFVCVRMTNNASRILKSRYRNEGREVRGYFYCCCCSDAPKWRRRSMLRLISLSFMWYTYLFIYFAFSARATFPTAIRYYYFYDRQCYCLHHAPPPFSFCVSFPTTSLRF